MEIIDARQHGKAYGYIVEGLSPEAIAYLSGQLSPAVGGYWVRAETLEEAQRLIAEAEARGPRMAADEATRAAQQRAYDALPYLCAGSRDGCGRRVARKREYCDACARDL